jgi:hypothetical protein
LLREGDALRAAQLRAHRHVAIGIVLVEVTARAV